MNITEFRNLFIHTENCSTRQKKIYKDKSTSTSSIENITEPLTCPKKPEPVVYVCTYTRPSTRHHYRQVSFTRERDIRRCSVSLIDYKIPDVIRRKKKALANPFIIKYKRLRSKSRVFD